VNVADLKKNVTDLSVCSERCLRFEARFVPTTNSYYFRAIHLKKPANKFLILELKQESSLLSKPLNPF